MTNFQPIEPINGLKIPEVPGLGKPGKVLPVDKNNPSFSGVLQDLLKDVNSMQNTAQQSVKKLATGEVKDIHQVMIAMNEADVAFKLMMEIRNQLVSAYNQLMKTPM